MSRRAGGPRSTGRSRRPGRFRSRLVVALLVLPLVAALAAPTAGAAPVAPADPSAAPAADDGLAAPPSATPSPNDAEPGAAPAASVAAIDRSNRQAVNDAYLNTLVPALGVNPAWDGSVSGCRPGAGIPAADAATLTAVNFVRSLSGIGSVALDATYSAKARADALINEANNTISHSPSPDWACYTADGYEAAQHSNLAYGSGGNLARNANAVLMYMDDPGSSNTAAGHRRWIQTPGTQRIGTGTSARTNALWVIDGGNWSVVPSGTPRTLSWPTAGFFPAPLEPGGRWSFTLPYGQSTTDDLTNAQVTVRSGAGTGLALTRYAPQFGYGPDTLVWDVAGIAAPSGTATSDYTVTITGATINGSTAPYTYVVRLFDPVAGPRSLTATPTPTIAGTPKVGVSLVATTGSWSPAPVALAYQWRRSGTAIGGATSSSYVPVAADVGKTISVVVTGSKPGYTSVSRASVETAVVQAAAPAPTVSRLAGDDRWSTAVEVTRSAFADPVSVLWIATGENFPDALSAAAAAGAYDEPLLLVQRDAIPAVVQAEIARLSPIEIRVVGDVGVVSAPVYEQLGTMTDHIKRIAGADRYATSRAVVDAGFANATTAYIATGRNFPDALSATAAGGSKRFPVVLVDGKGTAADAATIALLRRHGITKTIIVGGTDVVSSAIASSLVSAGFSARRVQGADRYLTSQAVNRDGFASAASVYLATGANFPDALAGASVAGSRNAPLYVVPTNCVPRAVLDDIATLGARKVVLLGGPDVLSESVRRLTAC